MKEHVIQPPHDGRRAFNASICEFRGKLLMAYRVSHHDKPDTLRIAKLDRETFEVVKDSELNVPVAEGWGAEDPRLFVHNDRLHVAWTAADYSRRPWRAAMFYGEVEGVTVRKAYRPNYGLNLADEREKNWQFWSEGGCLFAQYGPSPQRIIQLDGDKILGEWWSEGFEWGHGKPSGGTPPIRTERGTLISFFHAFVTDPERIRVYNFAAMEFDRVAPFKIRAVSPGPIMVAHDQWPMTTDNWSPLCVFPSGAIRTDGGYLVSAGINDCGIRLFEISDDEIPLVDPVRIPVVETGYFRALTGFLFGGRVRPPGEVLELGLDVARKLLKRNWIQPYENQTA